MYVPMTVRVTTSSDQFGTEAPFLKKPAHLCLQRQNDTGRRQVNTTKQTESLLGYFIIY